MKFKLKQLVLRYPFQRFLLGVIVVVTLASLTPNDQAIAQDHSSVLKAVDELDQQISELEKTIDQVRLEILSTRKTLSENDYKLQQPARELETTLAKQQELRDTIAKLQTPPDVTVEDNKPKSEKEDAESKPSEPQTPPLTIAQAEEQLSGLNPKIDALTREVETAKQAGAKIQEAIGKLQQHERELVLERQGCEREIEKRLREAGMWVSFANDIAPIFDAKCVICHNTRSAKGQYNMTSYAAILSEGESGASIQPKHADQSRLLELVEQGAMPPDSDPLSEQEIGLIRRWLDTGARLDIGLDASSPLKQVMPRVVQPAPPVTYPQAIPITALALDPQAKWLATAGYHEVLVWDVTTKQIVRRITNVAERVYGLALHADGKRLAVASGTPGQLGEVKLFDLHTGEMLHDLYITEDSMLDVAFSPDGTRLAACGTDGAVVLFDMKDMGQSPRVMRDHSDWVNSVSWSDDGSQLVTASRDKTSKVIDLESERTLVTFTGHGKPVTRAMFISEHQVASVGADKKVRLWDARDGKKVRDFGGFIPETAELLRLSDDKIIAAGSDGYLRIHSLKNGEALAKLKLGSRPIRSCASNAEMTILFMADDAGKVYQVESIDAPRLIADWTVLPLASP